MMRFQLGSEWKQVATKAWSMRLMGVAAVLSGLEISLPFIFEAYTIAPGTFAALSGLTTIAAFIARLMVQRMDDD